MAVKRESLLLRRSRAYTRDTLLLLREFRAPLLAFSLLVVGAGLLYFTLSRGLPGVPDTRVEAVYLCLDLIFLQAVGDFPDVWWLQVFWFAMPLLGLMILAQGLADFAVLLFNRRARGNDWEIAVASTLSNHAILVGLGHLGYRVTQHLHTLGQEVCVIERDPDDSLVASVRAMGHPVIAGDGTRDDILRGAGIERARAIILATTNDSLNLQMAVKARSIHPKIEVVVRIFDDEFAKALKAQFGFHALSATNLAAPLFAAAASGIDITPPLIVEGRPLSLARVTIAPRSRLVGLAVQAIEETYDVSVVLLRAAEGAPDMHPAGSKVIGAGDGLGVLGGPEAISRLVDDAKG